MRGVGFLWSSMVIFYILFQGYPIVCSIVYSLLDWSGLTRTARFVGLSNYKELLTDKLFWNAFLNSIKYTVMIVPLELAVSLILAYLLNDEKLKGRGVYRTMYFIPVVTTASVVGIIMIFIMGVQGPVNHILMSFHLLRKPINFLGNLCLGNAVVSADFALERLRNIHDLLACRPARYFRDVYEAATVDGANRVQMFIHIVLPLIAPVGGVIATLCVINSLKVFDIVKTMTEGGPYYATDVIATYVYRSAFSSEIGMPRLGYASAAKTFLRSSGNCCGCDFEWSQSTSR